MRYSALYGDDRSLPYKLGKLVSAASLYQVVRGLQFMRPVALSDEIAVGEMPSADEIAILSRAGFRSLLNVQPEGEVERLLSAAEIAAGAAAVGMKHAHVPVASRRVPPDTVDAFARALMTLPRPIYACCYSGSRAAAVWALAVAPTMAPADIAANCSAAGFDMSALLPELELRHGKVAATIAAGAAPAAAAPTQPTGAAPLTAAPEIRPGAPMVIAASAAPVVALAPASAPAAAPTTASAAIDAAEKIIFPRAAGSGGFSTAG